MKHELVMSLFEAGDRVKPIKQAAVFIKDVEDVDFEAVAKHVTLLVNKPEPAFVPHLRYTGIHGSLGDLGTPSPFKDEEGCELFVGDVVEISSKNGAYGMKHLTFVCSDKGEFFVMGIQDCCNSDAGVIDEKWRVRKVRDHANVLDGEEHSFAVCVRSSSSAEKNQKPNFGALLAAMLSAAVGKE